MNTPLASESLGISGCLPKEKFPGSGLAPGLVERAVMDELMLDGNSRQNLATFCQTWLEPGVHRLLDACIDKNMVDKDEYPQTAEIERRCVRLLADLWNAPDAGNAVGCSTTGSSEAAMLGGMAPLGCGWVLWREKEDLPEDLVFHVNYLGGDMPSFALNFSRPGVQIIAQYYNFVRLGRDGYRAIHSACYEAAAFLAGEIAKLGVFEVLFGGVAEEGIPAHRHPRMARRITTDRRGLSPTC